MSSQLCFDLQAAHSTYWLTTGLKRTTNASKSFCDKTVSNHTGLPQSRQAWWWHQRQCVWMESLGGGKDQLIQAKGTRSSEGKQTPWCPVWLFRFFNFKQQIHDMLLPAHLCCVESSHGLAWCQQGAHPARVLSIHLVAQWLLCPGRGRCQWRAL